MNAEAAAAPNPAAAAPPNLPPPAAPQQNGTNVRSPNTGPVARAGAAALSPSLGVPPSRAERLPRAASISPALQAGRHYGSNVNYNNNNNNHSCSSSSKSSSGAGAYAGACANLVSPSSSSAASSATAACARSPMRDSKVDSVPRTHASNKRLRKNASAAGASNRSSLSPEPPTKKAKMNGALFAGHHQQSQQPQQQHHYHAQDTERLLSPPSAFGSAAYAVAERLAEKAGASAADDDDESLGVAPLAHVDEVDSRYRESATIPEPEPDPPPAPASSKKRRSKKANKKKQSEEDVVREKLQALSKTGRVKTTEELVADLKSLNDDRLAAPAAETDNAVGSTAGTTLKPSLSNSSCYSNEGAAPARRHLRHAGDGDSAAGASCAADETTTTAASASGAKVPLERLDPEARVEREIADILARLPPLDPALIRWDDEEPQSPPASPRPPPTDEQVERYLRQRWDGVNGCVTHGARRPDAEAGVADDGFRKWHEMVARHTANDDLIHILPYSIVD